MDFAIIGVLMLLIVLGLAYLIRRRGADVMIGIIGLIIVLVLAYFFLPDIQCRKLKKHGFDYEITGGVSPTWDNADFFFKSSEGKKVKGPSISGSSLKVRCRDVDGDGVAEFIIQSKVYKTYQTILKVDLESGSYHVHYTKGLKVDYPQEGYHFL